jgi:uncharacterized protein (UPF0548 family)
VIGTGPERFTHAAHQILTWQLHQRAGLRPQVSAPAAQPNAVLLLRIGTGRLAISAPCRVITVINEPRRQGFAYGTLPGHPEQGEEAFTVEHTDDGTVILTITAFSKPASLLAHAAGPISRAVQRHITTRYVNALTPYPTSADGRCTRSRRRRADLGFHAWSLIAVVCLRVSLLPVGGWLAVSWGELVEPWGFGQV